MGDLNIQLRLNGIVVDDQNVRVRATVVLGDFPGACVLFPGAAVRVRRVAGELHASATTTTLAARPSRA